MRFFLRFAVAHRTLYDERCYRCGVAAFYAIEIVDAITESSVSAITMGRTTACYSW